MSTGFAHDARQPRTMDEIEIGFISCERNGYAFKSSPRRMSSPNETGCGEIHSANLPFWFLFSSVTYDVFVLAFAKWMSVMTFGDSTT